jgi:thioredoxin reductase
MSTSTCAGSPIALSQRDAAFAHLPLERTGPGLLVTDEFGRTAVTGIYAAGDLVTPAPAVVQALASAQRAAVGVTRDLSGAA